MPVVNGLPTYGKWGGPGWSSGRENPLGYRLTDADKAVSGDDALDELFKKHDIAYDDAEDITDLNEKTHALMVADADLLYGLTTLDYFDHSNYDDYYEGINYHKLAFEAFLGKTFVWDVPIALLGDIEGLINDINAFLTSQSPYNPNSWDDSNSNGLLNENDPDMDGDWLLNEEDPDMDGDGILNEKDEHPQDPRTLNDIDGDGIANDDDNDIDGDEIKNWEDDDVDGDGLNNNVDDQPFDPRTPGDIDGDRIPNSEDLDQDGDATPNSEDSYPDDITDQPKGNPDSIDPGAYGMIPCAPPYWKPDDKVIDAIKDQFGAAERAADPLILDLDGDGVETTGMQAGAYFDHGGDGFAEQTGWVGKDDGLLVLDRNGNGLIDNGSELFSDNTLLANGQKAANGFAALAELDRNHDGLIDAQDAAFADLRVWKDVNGDGYSQTSELLTLSEAGLHSLATNYISSTLVDANANAHKQEGTFTRIDGTTAKIADVWFVVNHTHSIATEWLNVPDDIAALPDAKGYGRVYDLHQAMVRDESGELKSLVGQFVAAGSTSEREMEYRSVPFFSDVRGTKKNKITKSGGKDACYNIWY